MSAEQSTFVAGLSLPSKSKHTSDDAASLLQKARTDSYDFCVTSLPHFSTRSIIPPRLDVTALESKWWSTSIVGEVSEPPSHEDNMMVDSETAQHYTPGAKLVSLLSDPSRRIFAERSLRDSITWAGHMNIPAVILPPIPSDSLAALNYANLLCSLSLECSATNVQLWVRVPFTPVAFGGFELLARRINNASNLGVMLCFGVDQHSTSEESVESSSSIHISSIGLLHRFLGMNCKCVSFDTGIFLTNKRGYPTLSKSYQMLFIELLRRVGRTVRVLVEGGCRHHPPLITTDINGATGCLPYLQYLRHLRNRQEVTSILDTEESNMETPYLDHLQSPLQPLGDDLEFSTYEVFEKDPVKYQNYQNAVELALRDKVDRVKGHLEPLTMAEKMKFGNNFTHRVTIIVLGAGRGPLIRSSLAAVEAFNRSQAQDLSSNINSHGAPNYPVLIKARVIAVEKNPLAVLFLRSLCAREEHWDESTVKVIESDMRDIGNHPEIIKINKKDKGIADIIVSELLGSFGDNELSPECLDGAENSGIMKEDCVSIPERYSSYIAPVTSRRLHSEAKAQAYSPSSPTDGPGGQPYGIQRALETAYVVRCHASSQTHPEQKCFTFSHPATTPIENDKFVHLTFEPDPSYGTGANSGYGPYDSSNAALAAGTQPTPITIHGFLGTFAATLYKSTAESTISIAPSSFSRGMFSWFPLYFPLREPMVIPVGATLEVSFWRRIQTDRVWYEWCAEVVLKDGNVVGTSGMHNPNGRSYIVKL